MNQLLFVFPIFILVMCFAFEAHGVEFYEVHDFAEEPEDFFSVKNHSIFSYDRDGNIIVDGRPQGRFRLPGLPHEYNEIPFMKFHWRFCFNRGCENRECCSRIKICFNHNPGYVADCDMWVSWRDSQNAVYSSVDLANGFGDLKSTYLKQDLDSANCLHGDITLEDFSKLTDDYDKPTTSKYLVGGEAGNDDRDVGCDAYVKISGEKIPKCVWRWVAKPELQCDNRFGATEDTEVSYEMEMGWTLTNAQSTGGSEKWGESTTISGTHTASKSESFEFKPSVQGTSIIGLTWGKTTGGSITAANGWNHETMKSWTEITTRGTHFTEKFKRSIKCKKGQWLSTLQKVWTCGDYVVKTGMFKTWDMSMTKERYAQEADKWKGQTVFLSDLNRTTHVPNTTDAPTNVSGNTVHVSTSVLLAIPALLLLWFG